MREGPLLLDALFSMFYSRGFLLPGSYFGGFLSLRLLDELASWLQYSGLSQNHSIISISAGLLL